jgi:uroporphyrinogen III methyltransferase/synthase
VRVLVTRALLQSDETIQKLRGVGAEVVYLPMIEILPPDSWEPFDTAVSRLSQFDWIVFASANAVDAFFTRVDFRGPFPGFASIGPKTTAALKRHGQQATYQAESFVAESFVEKFPITDGMKVLWPKTNIGRTLIADELRKRGAYVETVFCYRTELPTNAASIAKDLKRLLQDKLIDVVLLASSQTAKNMRALLDMEGADLSLLSTVKILAIGPETARAAAQHLGKCDVQSSEYTLDGMIDSLLSLHLN